MYNLQMFFPHSSSKHLSHIIQTKLSKKATSSFKLNSHKRGTSFASKSSFINHAICESNKFLSNHGIYFKFHFNYNVAPIIIKQYKIIH